MRPSAAERARTQLLRYDFDASNFAPWPDASGAMDPS